MDPRDIPPRLQRGLAVTLVSGSHMPHVMRAAASLADGPSESSPQSPSSTVETEDDEDFAVELAQTLCSQAEEFTGSTAIALEPAADPLEIGLVLEHVFEARDIHDAPLGIDDVVAVTSVDEIRALLFGDHGPTADHDSAEKLAVRLEFASVIAVSDSARHPESALGPVRALLRRLNPEARILPLHELPRIRRGHAILRRGRAHRIAASMGWQHELAGRSAFEGGPVGSAVFRDPRPFHPGRLRTAVENELGDGSAGRLLRSRGLVRLATRPDQIGLWSSAGDCFRLDPTSMDAWDENAPLGQELVFFGERLDIAALFAILDTCLLTGEELIAGPSAWSEYVDPFPAWEARDHDHH